MSNLMLLNQISEALLRFAHRHGYSELFSEIEVIHNKIERELRGGGPNE